MNPAALLSLLVTLPAAAAAADYAVNPDAGNSGFSAVFDAALGERITAVSSAVGCQVTFDERTGTASGRCSVPLESIRVDNDDTKSDHFRQWATNKKSEPRDCRLEAVFTGVQLGALAPERAVPFTASVPFTVCGRTRAGGGAETVTGTAMLFPPGTYGEARTIRIRATVSGFDREAYLIGPKHTDGWLARVQSLAKVVAERGTVELSLFAKAK
ncbi:MAG: hypothetical protein IPO09_13495 [Anaeromyxobacter sp.]|nr:hypothetical protein [Anaeromyxobacter sp.]MBL0275198.1 hypothetical protein [Anaeromyxobacter sp.]